MLFLCGAGGRSLPSAGIMFRIKSFQRRILLALMAIGLVPTALLLLAGTLAVRQAVSSMGTAGAWGSVGESGQVLLERMDSAGVTDPGVLEAAVAHREALSRSLRFSQMVSFLGDRFLSFLPLVGLSLAILIGALAFWVARQLSRGFSRPIADLVAWTRLIGQGHALPAPGPADSRGVLEFTQLREALRSMATELEEGRTQAIQAAKLRSWTEMARRVAHELKNPLTPMRMAAGTVLRLEDRAAREAGEVLLEEIQRLDEMARTFAQFGRMPEGPASQVDLGELLQGLIRQHAGGSSALRLEIRGEIPMVLGHHDALERSFRNLLLNALDAAGAEGRIELRVWQEGEVVLTEIQDWGPGIPQENLDRIWEPEFTTKSRGTGLGLPMVRQTIAAHHGRVEARNHAQGGAVFLVALPLTPPG